jgi:hypothetical protein
VTISKANRDAARAKALTYLETRQRPLLVGYLTLLLGHPWRVDDVQALMDELKDAGHVRELSAEERRHFDVREGYLLGDRVAPKARPGVQFLDVRDCFERAPANRREVVIPVLPSLCGQPWGDAAAAYLFSIRPTWVEVIRPDGEPGSYLQTWQARVYLDENDRVKRIEQSVLIGDVGQEVGVPV